MKIAIIGPTHKSFIRHFLPNFEYEKLPEGYYGAPFLGTLIHELLKNGHSVVAITTTEARSNNYSTTEFVNSNFKWVVVASRKRSFRFNGLKPGRMVDFFFQERNELTRQIILNQPDIVHAHWSYEFAHSAINSKLPTLITVHDNPYKVFKHFKNAYRLLRLFHSGYVLRRAKFISTVSPYMLPYVEKFSNTPIIIPNPIMVKFDVEEISKLVNVKADGLANLKVGIITNGWSGLKNGINGLLAFKEIIKTLPNAELHLFGIGSEENGEAFSDARKLNMQHVFFHGALPNDVLITQMEALHVVIHPALEESFGVVLIEAMSLGIPVVGGINSGAVPWVINEEYLLADVSSPKSISGTLLNLVTNKEIYISYAQNAFSNVKKRFSSEFVCNEYLTHYKFILKH